jgi:hypothetical protein
VVIIAEHDPWAGVKSPPEIARELDRNPDAPWRPLARPDSWGLIAERLSKPTMRG